VRCAQLTQKRHCSFYVNAEESFKQIDDDFFFVERVESDANGTHERRPRDLEDLVAYGRQRAACPYFLSREATAEADILFMPYNYLFDAKCRRSLGLDVEGDIVICDEAHNLEGICCDSLSFDFTAVDRQRCVAALEQLTRALSCGLLNREAKDGPGSDQGLQAADIQTLLEMLLSIEEQVTLVCTSDASCRAGKRDTDRAAEAGLEQRRHLQGIDGVVLPGRQIGAFFHKATQASDLSDERYEQLSRALEAATRALTQLRQQDVASLAGGPPETMLEETAVETEDADPYLKLRQRHQYTTENNPNMAWTHQVHALEQFSHVLELVWAFGKAETASAFAICVHDSSRNSRTTRAATDSTRLKTDSLGQRLTPRAASLHQAPASAERRETVAYTKPPEHAFWGVSSPAFTLSFWCLWPGLALRRAVADAYAVLLTSGTLSPMESYASEMSIPFPVRLRNAHVVDPRTQVFAAILTSGPRDIRLNSSYANRNNRAYILDLGSALINIARLSPRGMLIFFPSYAVLAQFVEIWQTCSFSNAGQSEAAHRPRRPTQATIWDRLNTLKRIYMEPRAAEAAQQTIQAYRQWIQSGHDACLLAVCRGRTGEGIDFADEYGRTVVLVGLPFPSTTDPRIILKRDYLERQALELHDQGRTISGRSWYVQQCLRAANQAMGRVIRHAHDFGAILLCDERFRAYGRELPLWLTATPTDAEQRPLNVIQTIERFGDLIAGLCAFWRSGRIRELAATRQDSNRESSGLENQRASTQRGSGQQCFQLEEKPVSVLSREQKRARLQASSLGGKTSFEEPSRAISASSPEQALSFSESAADHSSLTSRLGPSPLGPILGPQPRAILVKRSPMNRRAQPGSRMILERIRTRVGDRTFNLIFQHMKRYYRAAMASRATSRNTEMHHIHAELERLVADATDFHQLCLLLGHEGTAPP
jgi:Rad3-related DNA helicase